MKPEVTVMFAYEDEIEDFHFPVHMSGYDPYSSQYFEGKFSMSNNVFRPIEYTTDKGMKISPQTRQHAKLFLTEYERQYRNI